MSVNDELNFDDLLYDVEETIDEYGEPLDTNEDEPEDDTYEDDGEETEEETDELDEADETDDSEEEEPPAIEDEKPVQTPEENAKFAEMRRQKQLEQEMQSKPEFQIAKLLSEQYGMTPDQLYEKMQEAALERQAQEQQVPVEFLREQQAQAARAKELEDKLAKLEFDSWYAGKQAEIKTVTEKYKGIISEQEATDALSYMLNELGTTSMSLDKVVRAVHGDKIEAELRKIAKQEALAEISGRKKSPLAPQGGKSSSNTEALSADEKYIARQMGLTEEEYLKYK